MYNPILCGNIHVLLVVILAPLLLFSGSGSAEEIKAGVQRGVTTTRSERK